MDSINFMNLEGLKFFGKVNASISHELKNILAIISETTGLLNDLTDLAKKGKDLNLSMVESCSNSIAEEIQRGFTTIKQMNTFAHNVDVPIKEINLWETLDLTVKLSKFLSFASNVHMDQPDQKIKPVLTCPFLLQNLIYQVLCFTYESAGTGKIDINFDLSKNEGIHLIFSGQDQMDTKNFPTPKIQKAAEVLGVKLTINARKFDLLIPYDSNKINELAKAL
ncbi:MAG: hypothetical protein GY860_07115 [Desulfobacteraceae bacterium]|nr:hypothetical protein [Desulfobacteraceae bacterium]